MISDVWLSDFTPGAELFRSEREFRFHGHGITHSPLMFISFPGPDGPRTAIQLQFRPVDVLRVQRIYPGLVVRCATAAEAAGVTATLTRPIDDGAHVLLLESGPARDFVVCQGFGWREGVLPRMQAGFYNAPSRYDPMWPTGPFAGTVNDLDFSPPAEVAATVIEGFPDQTSRRDRRGWAWVLTARDGSSHTTVGVFLSETDAEEAADLLRPTVRSCRVDQVPIAF
ncbi:hypothetical protein FHR83_002286 [Actinoplanes campanulatus]|uniref:Uncharacterized protein n=1 Tax=Actinoplanes campanulatus TaxID=113559 RepID=A0A7W5AEA4_9ACTN|nr:hypothetical protein [Actinoplanes campanulatus]MBB3094623.1 hypothetical protein [Actinoplanes campanulatus]GGN06369.1 hypothetical protein GCM10010109_14110 [Actinoplanes campanulatus]GID35919.1 hypothetical protein Aca09nite_24250 [Actinoplanes campanulatus]